MGKHYISQYWLALQLSRSVCGSWGWNTNYRSHVTSYLGSQCVTGPWVRPKPAVAHWCAHWLSGRDVSRIWNWHGPDISYGVPARWLNEWKEGEESKGKAWVPWDEMWCKQCMRFCTDRRMEGYLRGEKEWLPPSPDVLQVQPANNTKYTAFHCIQS